MIFKEDIISAIHEIETGDNPIGIMLSDDKNYIISSKDNKCICSVDDFLDFLKKKFHCDFECIFHEHINLTTIYRCKECGAVIFSGDDERYDPGLCCPVCSGYDYKNYWSKEDIENDAEKQERINQYMEYQRILEESRRRRESRNGLYDWQVWKHSIYRKKKRVYLELLCDDYFKSKVKGLMLEIRVFYKESGTFVHKKAYIIPLSWSALKITKIQPILNKWRERKNGKNV